MYRALLCSRPIPYRATALLTRHISIRRAWVSERSKDEPHREQELEIVYCPTECQVADILTKPLTGALLLRMTCWILGWMPHPGPAVAARQKGEDKIEKKIGA
jgi:hypothetical protein